MTGDNDSSDQNSVGEHVGNHEQQTLTKEPQPVFNIVQNHSYNLLSQCYVVYLGYIAESKLFSFSKSSIFVLSHESKQC